jgi:hypothetical protein
VRPAPAPSPHVAPCPAVTTVPPCRLQFVNVLDMGHKVVEYNQENLRITSLEGGSSLIRSFPSKVSVRATSAGSNPSPLSVCACVHVWACVAAGAAPGRARRGAGEAQPPAPI